MHVMGGLDLPDKRDLPPLPLRERVGVRGLATLIMYSGLSHLPKLPRLARPLIRPFGPPSPARGEGKDGAHPGAI